MMTVFTRPFFPTVLLLSVCSITALAKSKRPRTRPVLGSVGASRTRQEQSQTAPQDSGEVDEGSIVRVSTSLIAVPTTVMDRNGRYIANLRKEDFRIYEDGVEQTIANFSSIEKPFTVALMLDVSGSTQAQLSQIREAANTFVGRLRFNDRLMAISFDGQVHVLTEPALVSDIRRGKLHIPAVTDGTVLYDAVAFPLTHCPQLPRPHATLLITNHVDETT